MTLRPGPLKDQMNKRRETRRRKPHQAVPASPKERQWRSVRWTAHEDQIIQNRYPTDGSRGVAKLLPHRGLGAIHTRAVYLGVQRLPRESSGDRWSAREDQILRQYYRYGSEICGRRLPGRTRTAIKQRAARLGLRCWNPEKS